MTTAAETTFDAASAALTAARRAYDRSRSRKNLIALNAANADYSVALNVFKNEQAAEARAAKAAAKAAKAAKPTGPVQTAFDL